MNDVHLPDPEFVSNLERELRSALRRQEQFRNGSPATMVVIHRLRGTTGLVALAAMCVGGAATLAVTHRLDTRTADLIVARAEARLEFARARLDLFVEEVQEAESQVAAGIVAPEQIDSMRLELAHLEADAAARALDVEEARITGRDPDNSLSAPTVRGRDFATERLKLDQSFGLARLSWIEKQASAHGLGSNESSISDREQEAAIAREQEAGRAALSDVVRRLHLRRDYISGVCTAREVEATDMQFSVEAQRGIAARRVDEARGQLDRIRTLVEAGYVPRAQARAAEMELRAALLQLELADLQVQIIESKLAEPSDQ